AHAAAYEEETAMTSPHLSRALSRLLVGAALAASCVVSSREARADGPGEGGDGFTLERAERVEKEGRELFDRGDKADGARRIAEAWKIRAEVFAREAHHAREAASPGGGGEKTADAKAEVDRIRAALAERERAVEAARA